MLLKAAATLNRAMRRRRNSRWLTQGPAAMQFPGALTARQRAEQKLCDKSDGMRQKGAGSRAAQNLRPAPARQWPPARQGNRPLLRILTRLMAQTGKNQASSTPRIPKSASVPGLRERHWPVKIRFHAKADSQRYRSPRRSDAPLRGQTARPKPIANPATRKPIAIRTRKVKAVLSGLLAESGHGQARNIFTARITGEAAPFSTLQPALRTPCRLPVMGRHYDGWCRRARD